MVKGGYQIIDLEDRNFEKLSINKYKGIYEKLDGTRKACILSGIKINGIEQRDVFVNFRKIESQHKYECSFECIVGNSTVSVIVSVTPDSVFITW